MSGKWLSARFYNFRDYLETLNQLLLVDEVNLIAVSREINSRLTVSSKLERLAMKIISKHSPDAELKVALDIQSWVPRPMVFNEEKSQWEYQPDTKNLESVEKIHFKFISSDGSWFTDNDFPKELDGGGNENNVIYAEAEKLALKNYVTDELKEDHESPVSTPKRKSDVTDGKESVEIENNKGVAKQEGAAPFNGDKNNEEDESNRPNTGSTILAQQGEHTAEYRSLLNRVVTFLKKMFKRWFSFGNKGT